MTQILRMFQSSIDPAHVDEVHRLFVDDVLPVFRALPGCAGIELWVSTEKNAGGLVEGAAMSRWESREAMEAAVGSRAAREAQVRIVGLLCQEPVVRVFEVLA